MKRSKFSGIGHALVSAFTASALFLQVTGCANAPDDTDVDVDPQAALVAAVAECKLAQAVAVDGPAVAMNLKQSPDGSVHGTYAVNGVNAGPVDFAPDLLAWNVLPTGQVAVGLAGDPSTQVVIEESHVLPTGGISVTAKRLDGTHKTTIELPDFDTSVLTNASGGEPNLTPQGAPVVGPVAAFCVSNPWICIIVGAAVVIAVTAMYAACLYTVSNATAQCQASGNCPSGGGCGIGAGKWYIGINTNMPTCTSCSNTPPAPQNPGVCPPVGQQPVPPTGPLPTATATTTTANPPPDVPGQEGF